MKYNFYKLLILPIVIFVLLGIEKSSAQNEAPIKLDSLHQIIRGFGAANILPWRPDMTQDEIKRAFGTGDGQLGFSILRLRLPSDENSFAANIPTAKAAHEMGVTIFASPWSPPASMKTNNNIVGGELIESKYAEYAAYLKKFSDFMTANGVPIYAVSVQNEPDIKVSYESCDWTPAQMLKFVKEHGKNVGTKLIAPESFQFRREMSDPLLNDPAALSSFDILGGHIYGGGLAEYPLAKSKKKEVWMTEHLVLETDWANNLATGKEILDCLYSGMNAYIWWYIVRFYGPIYDDGSDPRTPAGAVKGQISKRGYVMSQFSRFIRPGYYRVESFYSPQRNVYMSAFKDPATNKIVIVAINTSPSNIVQPFALEKGTTTRFIPYVTTSSKNCVTENSITVTNNTLTATLEASSITTFVSDNSTSVNDESEVVPSSFSLFQNYPNPFNPTTTISFSLPETSFISLSLVDVLGKEIKKIAEGPYDSGYHNVILNASDLSSGIYFYRLVSNNFSETKKLIVVK